MPHTESTPRRWDPWTSKQKHRRFRRRRSSSLGLLTPDRIGDHLVARCMALDDFRARNAANGWTPEALGGPRMNSGSRHVLQGIGNTVNDHIQTIVEYEDEHNALIQLAQTGYIVQQISRLNRLLDVTLTAYGIPEPYGTVKWQTVFQQERRERMTKFQKMIADKTFLMQSLGDEQQQLEVLTLLVYDFQKHSDDTYTDLEYEVIADVYDTCSELSGLTIVAVPEWFAPAYETRHSRWQGTSVDVERLLKQSEELCIRQASAWWDLHHPHMMKLFGACHVGKSLTLVRESAQCVKTSVSSRDVLLGTAHVLQFLHERHVMPTNLKLERLFSTEMEHKVKLHGGELLSPMKSPMTNSNCQRLTTNPLMPSCPAFLKHEEWGLIKQVCAEDISTRGDASYVMKQFDHHNKPTVRHFWNRKVHQRPQNGSGIVKFTSNYVDPKFHLSVEKLLQEITDNLDGDESASKLMDGYVFERLMSVHQQLLGTICSKELIRSFVEILVRFKASLIHRAANSVSSFCVASSRSVEYSNISFHGEIDALVARCGFIKSATTSIHDWNQHCNFLRLNQQGSFQLALDKLMDGLDDEEGRIEAATLLVFEATKHRSSYDRNQLRAIERTATSIVGLSGDQGSIAVPKWFIPRYEVEIDSQISAGSFGAVHHGKWLNATVAVKCLFRSDQKLFLREANIWFTLNHPNIVKLYGACHVGKIVTTRSLDEPTNRTDRRPFFVCEFASEGTLNEYLKKWEIEHKSRSDVWRCLCEAARGLEHLHERGIIHGDLKGNNILVGGDYHVKLTDFGLSTVAKKLKWTGGTGTSGAIRWKAPERLGSYDRGPSFASDIYSFGMCIIEAVTGTFPWCETMDEDLVVSEVTRGKLLPRPDVFNNEQWDLVSRMCCFDPANRVTISAVVALLGSLC
ncbi:Tyrosine-protein kinase STK [Phytophthora citrophthora]|uniref:Tyrosine-protein kinase STK n=1 Tax=Phytophthora citrophthora TaxID=4793 RepID=A0AAD9LMX1_9STRA|nr:Tyrosine-protein kinase STK [Phytophthora citrophthora]